MRWLLEVVGELIDSVIGPSTTVLETKQHKHSIVEVEPTFKGDKVHLVIRSRQIIFRTVFTRWFIPDIRNTVYEVVGIALPEHHDRLDQKLLEPVVFPSLANPLLKWTQYPHMYAINAYLDRAAIPHDSVEV